MKVLHVIPSISKQAGGPSQAIIPMCRALTRQNIDVLLATTDDNLSDTGDRPKLECGRITEYADLPIIFFPSQLGASYKYSRPFAQWLQAHVADYELVHIHAVFNHACIAAARACRRQNVPYVIRPLGTLDPWSMNQKQLRKKIFWHGGVKSLIEAAAAVHYTAAAEKTATEQSLGLNHGVVIPLGVDVVKTQDTISRESLNEKLPHLGNHPYVLVLSRLLPTKGLDPLLDAFLRLLKKNGFAEWRLVFAGEGPAEYVAKLKKKVATAEACENVLFAGWVDGEVKQSALSNAALLALPSYHENFGLCVMEALAYGIPVLISPQVTLSAEVQSSGAGWVSKIQTNALSAALESALGADVERSRRGRAGRELAGKYDWLHTAEQLCGLYSSILTRPATVF